MSTLTEFVRGQRASDLRPTAAELARSGAPRHVLDGKHRFDRQSKKVRKRREARFWRAFRRRHVLWQGMHDNMSQWSKLYFAGLVSMAWEPKE